MQTRSAAATRTGRSHRAQGAPNEDRTRQLDRAPIVVASGRGALYAVADGVGGAPRGMAAAQRVVDDLLRFYRDPGVPPGRDGILEILGAASAEVRAWGELSPDDVPDGAPWRGRPLGAAACTVLWVPPGDGGKVTLFQVGDTAGFLVHDGGARRVTTIHGGGGALVRFVGQDPLQIDVVEVAAVPGDTAILASDGVWAAIGADVLARCVAEEFEPADVASRIVRAAHERGSTDDLTAVVVEFE